MAYISFDPWLQKENGKFDSLADEDIVTITGESETAFREWRKTGLKERSNLLVSLGNHLREEKEQYAGIITSEMGKVITQAVAEIEKCASLCYYYAENLEKYSTAEKRKSSAAESYVFYEPQGVIIGVMPWNFPWWQAMRFLVPVIAGGNTALLKHASNVPICAISIQRAFTLAGFPENVCRNLFADYRHVDMLLRSSAIRGISLTGSNNAGRKVAASAGDALKKSVLELGGSDPVIVMDDADLEASAEGALFARFQNCGQSCIAGKRLLVHSGIYKPFVELLKYKTESVKVGNPYEKDTFIGPMVNEQSLVDLDRQVGETLSMGGELITGGARLLPDKPVYMPTVIVNAHKDSPLMKEEVFGPAVSVTEFKDTGEAVRLANDTIFGLGASVWTRNRELAMIIASAIDTGTVAINGFVRSDPALPFGGVRESGYGRELSAEGFREFLNIKTVSVYSQGI
jgi:succinate-semialdehyde dehydrogenase/glutarate-semialdehyde dehydrogenase